MTLSKVHPMIIALWLSYFSASTSFADVPRGWIVAGSSPKDYEFSQDSSTALSGHYSALIAAKPGVVPTGFGTLMQTIDAENYRDGRWRLSGYLKTSDATRAQMWMRVDGPEHKVVSFDNMDARPVTGTTPWTRYDIVLDVPPDSMDIAFGFLLTQGGKVWGDNFRLEKVPAEVPVTSPTTAATVLPKQPVNIDFEGAVDTGFKAEKTFRAEKINVYDMFRSNGRHGTQHPRVSSDTYNLCGMHVVAQTRQDDGTGLKWDIMLSVFTDGTSRRASLAAGSFTLPPKVNTIVPRHPITGLVVWLDSVQEPASARIQGIPNADNGVVGDFPEPYAEKMFDALERGMPFTVDLTYDSGEHETVSGRTLRDSGGGSGNGKPLGLGHGVDAPVHRCLQSLAPASQSGLHNPTAEFQHLL
jgi:hypothetical protein